MARDIVVRPSGTSWGAIIDGWLATVGVAAILSPIVGLMLANWYTTRGYASAVPILVAVGLAYLVGGYVAGRMAGYRTSWHGMMAAFLGLFVVLALLVVDIAFAVGVFGTDGRLVQILPVVLGVALYQSVETFAFGGALGILIAIFAAWLGGLLAPARIATAVTAAPVVAERQVTTTTETQRPRERFRLLPTAGRMGGERMSKDEVERTEVTDRIQPS
jgi:MFS family permease